MTDRTYILKLSCDDHPGIVAAVTTQLALVGANIAESNQFWDRQSNRFFMRIAFTAPLDATPNEIETRLRGPIDSFGMNMALFDASRRPTIIIMVSRFDHAMLHILYQIRVGWLHANVAAIVSNHEDSRRQAELEGIPYHFWPVSKDNKAEQEAKLLGLVQVIAHPPCQNQRLQ